MITHHRRVSYINSPAPPRRRSAQRLPHGAPPQDRELGFMIVFRDPWGNTVSDT
jgi:hypothetical protein